uniref:Protein kinase domain-containing protein n=1 Tax=viral metagenome TaxID=1070528 RepID=A0A6C0EUS0_9ZZZZ
MMPYENEEYTKYNPLHEELGITLTSRVATYENRISYNKYEIIDTSGNKNECFKKYITLVDYVKFLIGKYKSDDVYLLPNKDKNNDTKTLFEEYINSHHNYAYVDAFFYYLTSNLLDKGFAHGLKFYDSYLCMSKDCEIDIVDDFEYLCDSNYFNEKLNNLFHFKDDNLGDFFNKKKPITISDNDINVEFEQLDLNVQDENVQDENVQEQEDDNVQEQVQNIEDKEDLELVEDIPANETDSDDDSAVVDDSCSDCESKSGSDTDYETESDSNDKDEIEKLILVVKKIPTQVIAIENCEGTFDSLLEKNNLTIEELESAMFQVVLMLYVYQNVFDFTHNDLHTNNIMYITTEEPFLYYKIKDVLYIIPTFGKIYKIIDFGRSIYKVNDKLICSDSFSVNGTAHTQYNFEPFFNKNKNIVNPNKSFDLCRLACSMIDFIIDDVKQINKFKEVPVYDLIISWLYDDNGVNVLYKNNGEERYPDFKLYKMIARIVNNHTPEKQFDHPCFSKYIDSRVFIDLSKYNDIDELIKIPVRL